MWMKMTTCIRKVASEVFGVTKGVKCETKETWWWNEKVQKTIKEKKELFRRMHLDRSADNIERYKVTKKTAKRTVSETRGQMYVLDMYYSFLLLYFSRGSSYILPLLYMYIFGPLALR
jgi:hypothetical protein